MRFALLVCVVLAVGAAANYPYLTPSNATVTKEDNAAYIGALERRDPVAAAIQYTPVSAEALLKNLTKSKGIEATNAQATKEKASLEGGKPFGVKSVADRPKAKEAGSESAKATRLSGASPRSAKELNKACTAGIKALPWDKYEAAVAFLDTAAKGTKVADINVPVKTWKRTIAATDPKGGAALKAWEDSLAAWKNKNASEYYACTTARRLAEDVIAIKKAPAYVEFSVQLDTKISEALRTKPASEIRNLDVPLSEIPNVGGISANPNVLLKEGDQPVADAKGALPDKVVQKAPKVTMKVTYTVVEPGKASKFTPLYEELPSAPKDAKEIEALRAATQKASPSVADLMKQSWPDEDKKNWSTLDYIKNEERGLVSKGTGTKPKFRSVRPPAHSALSAKSTRLSPMMLSVWERATDSARLGTWVKGCAADCGVQYAKFGPAPKSPARIAGIAKLSAFDGQLDNNMRAALASALKMDATRANLEIAKKMSETILTHAPVTITIQTLLRRFREFINWAHTRLPVHFPADNNRGNWGGMDRFAYLFFPHSAQHPQYVNPNDKSGRVDGNNRILNHMVWTGEVGAINNEADFVAVENGANTREMLSLLYRTLYGRGHNGHGFLDILYRTLVHWSGAAPALATTVARELLAINVDIAAIANYNANRYQDICFPDVVAPNWGNNALEMPPRGWGFLKYQCSAVDAAGKFAGTMHQFNAGGSPTKLVDFSYSTRIRPSLTDREIDWLFGDWARPAVLAMVGGNARNFVRYEGSFLPWRCGGDVHLSHAKMPADHQGNTLPYSYPQWCADNLMRALGGPSKSTDLYMAPGWFLGLNLQQRYQLRAALAAWMEQGQDHSFHEVMGSAEAYGLPYVAYHHANDNWDRIWENLLVHTPNGQDYGTNNLIAQFRLDHPDQDCMPSDFLHADRVNHRAMQIWVNQGTGAAPALVALRHCRGIPALDLQPNMLPATDIYTHALFTLHGRQWDRQVQLLMTAAAGVKALVLTGDATSNAAYIGMNRDQLIAFPDWDVATQTARAAGGVGTVVLNVATSPLTYNSYGAAGTIQRHCLEFRTAGGAAVELCSHEERLFAEFYYSIHYFKNFNSHPLTFSDRQAHFQRAFSAAPIQQRDYAHVPPFDHPHTWANAKAWICGLNRLDGAGNAKLHAMHIDMLKHAAHCGSAAQDLTSGANGRDPANVQYSYELCVSGSIRHMTVGCAFAAPGAVCPPVGAMTTQGAYIRELAHRTAACLYTFGETIGDALNPASVTNHVLRDMFFDPMSLSWAPEYKHSMVFSGFSGQARVQNYLAVPNGQNIALGWTSFTREVLISWGYCHDSKVAPLNGGPALPAHEPFGLFILINTPAHFARQLRNSAFILDNQAEVLLHPGTYRVVHKRTYYSEETYDSGGAWQYDRTPGLYAEIYIEWLHNN